MEMRPLSALEVRKIFKGLYAAMLHCHDNQILIRCVLPDSVMVRVGMGELRQDEVHIKSSVEVKLCDLGYATELSHMEDNLWVNHPLNNLSLEPYISPELAWGDEYLFQTDIWTLGVLLHLMATNQLPFQREDCADKEFLSIKAQVSKIVTPYIHCKIDMVIFPPCRMQIISRSLSMNGLEWMTNLLKFLCELVYNLIG